MVSDKRRAVPADAGGTLPLLRVATVGEGAMEAMVWKRAASSSKDSGLM
jgi:hypothetical protein